MNACEVLQNANLTVLHAAQSIPAADWDIPGVCGHWSARDVMAHLASFEALLVEILSTFLSDQPTPLLERFLADIETFNDEQVRCRRQTPINGILQEYEERHRQALHLLGRIPPEMQWQNGTLPWYGEGYDLEDFLVYSYYGHKQEHSTQMMAFCDRIST